MSISLDFASWGFWFFLIVGLAWLAALVNFLKRTDLDGTTKICWVVVLCTLNLLGMILLLIWGPKQHQEPQKTRRLFEPPSQDEITDNKSSA